MSVECSTSKKLLGILRSLNQMTSTVLALSVRYSYEKSGIWMVVQISFKGFRETCDFGLGQAHRFGSVSCCLWR